jgi:hypothetical protein
LRESNSQSEKGTESQNYFRTQSNQSSLNLALKQIGKCFLSLSIRTSKTYQNGRLTLKMYKYQASHVHTKPFKTIPLSGDSTLATQTL